jgi:hypothetical protein
MSGQPRPCLNNGPSPQRVLDFLAAVVLNPKLKKETPTGPLSQGRPHRVLLPVSVQSSVCGVGESFEVLVRGLT